MSEPQYRVTWVQRMGNDTLSRSSGTTTYTKEEAQHIACLCDASAGNTHSKYKIRKVR